MKILVMVSDVHESSSYDFRCSQKFKFWFQMFMKVIVLISDVHESSSF